MTGLSAENRALVERLGYDDLIDDGSVQTSTRVGYRTLNALLDAARTSSNEDLRARVKVLEEALGEIARGLVPPEQHGHYLAHRQAVKIARAALLPNQEGGAPTPSDRQGSGEP